MPVVVVRLVRAVNNLAAFPRGRIVPEVGMDSIREVIFHSYRIVYFTEGELVLILAIVHAAMDLGTRFGTGPWTLN